MIDVASVEQVVTAAKEAAVVVDRSNLGVLKFSGETRLDLLHRMSTQAVNNLKRGEGSATVLTTDIGRIIDRLLLYVADDELLAVTGENNSENVARYLMRYVFFQDDFHITDLSNETAILAVYGRRAEALLHDLFAIDLPPVKHHWREVSWRGGTITIHRTDPVTGDGFLLICPIEQRDALWEYVATGGIIPGSSEAFEYLRIKSELPLFGHELTDEYIPLETGLWEDVSFTKGCYIGQEIIARMESRNRIAKRLVFMTLETMVPAGTEIMAGGRSAGRITSIADGPDGPAALGYVRSAFLDDDAEVALTAEGRPVTLAYTRENRP